MALYRIHPLVLGSKIFDKGTMTYQYGYGEEIHVPVFGWLIEGGEKVVLVDTGYLGPVITEAREKALGAKIYRFEEALSRFGLSPADIDLVLHTHLHNDHCENDFKCENAVFYAHRLEFEALYGGHPLDFRYAPDFVEELDQEGRFVKLEEDREILPGLRMIHTPGHTAGGMTVLVETERGVAAITGVCTLFENYWPPRKIRALGWEVIPPGVHTDAYVAYEQTLRIKKMADLILPLHEPELARIETVPDQWDQVKLPEGAREE
ncbi:N-acyl homoserine lactonase family protein [Thermosulfurimonas sp. F29]|uniref:N-acyl homoserine lactonase family protein n=1 Tax=Thermosulfurimonas sp. F29 TaxID=2867247 RepID=UPI001C82C9DA|nr:N-acyl homoserine lactonase family protein [Thermosulfurimonas sp. F29]MBX6422786.1 N-acyl homoserine lactonase family protein [Thermosulfurimonas sp. F29]